MPTPAERRALLFLAALAALGVTARGFTALDRSGDASPGGHAGLDRQIAAVDSAVAGTRVRSRAPKKITGEGRGASMRAMSSAADPADVAPPPENPLAVYEARRRAVEASNREARERTAEEAERLAPAYRSAAGPGAAVAGIGPDAASASRIGASRGLTVDLDIAGADAIAGLPWIGDALAARIVAERTARGPFGSLTGLQRVRGIGPGLAARIAPFVTFSRAALAQPHNPPVRPRRGRASRP
ncbi:MAG: helix-hairpin-helix domain-containing protein [Gemmatimonadota bacterium]|nr:helix-hairpin-helix domain-containing protein [Gemmatimonadota bacterium]